MESTTIGSNGVLLVTARLNAGVFTWDFRRRTSTGPTTGTWTLVTSVPTPTDAVWGRPAMEVRPFRVAGSTVDRLVLSWRTPAFGFVTQIRTSPRGTLLPGLFGEWTAADQFAELGDPTAHAAELSLDTRFNVKGLRGVWSGVVKCELGANCLAGSTCMSIAPGATLPDGTPVGPVNSCVSSAGLVQAIEQRTPGADGVQPMILPDFNEWKHLRAGFCNALRWESGPAVSGDR